LVVSAILVKLIALEAAVPTKVWVAVNEFVTLVTAMFAPAKVVAPVPP
jgi:hypothetical protein